MLIIVGLGNPGEKYARHRHNVGFMAVDAIAGEHRFGPERKKFQGLIREGEIGGVKFLSLKPQTFMNDSGQSVGAAMRFYKLEPANVVVFHDELDLAAGKIKAKIGGGLAGHNGLRSIAEHIGEEFRRVRIGIGHPGDKARVTGHVLGDFSKADQDWLAPLLDAIAKASPKLAEGDAKFGSAVAHILTPPKPKAPPKDVSVTPRAGDEAPKSENPFAAALKDLKEQAGESE
jgi:PTH1 family peptidyl-tRNA hydrolase